MKHSWVVNTCLISELLVALVGSGGISKNWIEVNKDFSIVMEKNDYLFLIYSC